MLLSLVGPLHVRRSMLSRGFGGNKVVDKSQKMCDNSRVGWEILRMRPCIELTYPEFSGCYALLKDGHVVYVGKSINVLNRLSVHRNRQRRLLSGRSDYGDQSKGFLQFESVRIYPCPMRELDQLERELILLYRPHWNVQVPRARVIDIAALAARANVTEKELGQWKRNFNRTYEPKVRRDYRRVAA